jgi:hypothetical protein
MARSDDLVRAWVVEWFRVDCHGEPLAGRVNREGAAHIGLTSRARAPAPPRACAVLVREDRSYPEPSDAASDRRRQLAIAVDADAG